MIENHYGITIIRTNPDAADFNINKLINQIYRHIRQSNKVKLKKEQVKIKKQEKKPKELEDKNKELEDEIKILKLQLANLTVKNNDDSNDNDNDNNNSHNIKSKNTVSL